MTYAGEVSSSRTQALRASSDHFFKEARKARNRVTGKGFTGLHPVEVLVLNLNESIQIKKAGDSARITSPFLIGPGTANGESPNRSRTRSGIPPPV